MQKKTTFFCDSEDISESPSQNRAKKRVAIKYSSTASLGSNAVKATMRRMVMKKSAHVFGTDLTVLMNREKKALGEEEDVDHVVPILVSQITSYLCDNALDTSGLFRVPGKHSLIMSSVTAIDDGQAITTEYLSDLDIFTIGDLLKKFLRDLPQPIIPVRRYYNCFIMSSTIEDPDSFIRCLGCLVRSLPTNSYNLLKHLCKFFIQLTHSKDKNKMNAANLSIIFGPLFFGQLESTDSMQIVMEARSTSKITKELIDNYDLLFMKKNRPSEFLVAKESYQGEDFSMIKGEDVNVLYYSENEEHCYIQIGSNFKLLHVEKSFVETKCKEGIIKENEDIEMEKQELENIRSTVLSRILTVPIAPQRNTTEITPGRTVISRKLAPIQPVASPRRRSESLLGRNLSPTLSHLKNSSPSILRRKSDQSPKNKKREKKTKRKSMDLLCDRNDDKKEDKKEVKKEKKERHKKINIAAWYNSPGTKSSASFFSVPKSKKSTSHI